MRNAFIAIAAVAIWPSIALAQRGVDNHGLTTDQVKQLQQAINGAGCDAGTVDGLLGPHTRRGLECIRQQRGVGGSDLNSVLQALNLGFTAPAATSESAGSLAADSTGHVRGTPEQTGGRNRGRIRPPADSTLAHSAHRTPPKKVQWNKQDTTGVRSDTTKAPRDTVRAPHDTTAGTAAAPRRAPRLDASAISA